MAYGSIREKGLGLYNICTIKGLTQLSAIVQFIGETEHITGKLLRAGIEAGKVEMGIGQDIFSLNYWKYEGLLTDAWIKNLWKFLWEKSIVLEEKKTMNLKTHRENDRFIMEDIVNLNIYSKAEIQHINRCRIYLQVSSLSDIATGDGNNFSYRAYRCEFDGTRLNTYIWPRQPRPGQNARQLWKQALKNAYPQIGDLLIHQLGQWTHRTSRRTWEWFYNHRSQLLYQCQHNIWKVYKRSSRAGNLGLRPTVHYHNQAMSLPNFSWRATVIVHSNNRVTLTGSNAEIPRHERRDTTMSKEETLNGILRELVEDQVSLNTSEVEVRRALRRGLLKIVSDGSYDKFNRLGTAAWIIATSRMAYLIGRHWTPGKASIQGSHRSELSGILEVILQMNIICKRSNVTEGTVELRCD